MLVELDIEKTRTKQRGRRVKNDPVRDAQPHYYSKKLYTTSFPFTK